MNSINSNLQTRSPQVPQYGAVLSIKRLTLLLMVALGIPNNTGLADEEHPSGPSVQQFGQVLVRVNGQPITEGDLRFFLLSRQVPESMQDSVRNSFLEQLIDRQLMQQFLTKRKAMVEPELLQVYVERIHSLILRKKQNPDEVLAKLGFNEEKLRQELALPLAWKHYVGQIITQQQLRQYWDQHRPKFDGTEVRASQIFLKVPKTAASADIQAAEQKLQAIRTDIVEGKIEFADGARQNSEAPSRESGGDLGFFPYRGPMPAAITESAFRLKVGEISQPIRSPFGMHLLTVTEQKPGQLSLEDARVLIFDELAEKVWNELVARERQKAEIEWITKAE